MPHVFVSLTPPEAFALCEVLAQAPDLGVNDRAAIGCILQLARAATADQMKQAAASSRDIALLASLRTMTQSLRAACPFVPGSRERGAVFSLLYAYATALGVDVDHPDYAVERQRMEQLRALPPEQMAALRAKYGA